MKKLAFLIALSLGGELVVAQDLTSKKGEPYLPEAGDYAISFDATPFLTYFGNMFSRDTLKNGAPYMQWTNSNYMVVNGKYFKDAKTAYRVSVRLGFGSSKQVGEIADATQTTVPTYPNLPNQKEDDVKFKHHNIGIGLGIEKRKGKTRLQGYYGADLWIWESGQSVHYDYGNTLAATGTTPVSVDPSNTTNFGSNPVLTSINPTLTGNLVKDTYGNNARITNATLGQTFGMGVRAFIGAEYFIFPKISIGAEYGYGLGFSITGNSSYSTESVGGTPALVGPQTITIKRSNTISLDNDINGGGSGTGTGSIKLTLHF
jgi:hypothetical protein